MTDKMALEDAIQLLTNEVDRQYLREHYSPDCYVIVGQRRSNVGGRKPIEGDCTLITIQTNPEQAEKARSNWSAEVLGVRIIQIS